jgi:1,4-dihydroxy-2-naphthoate octaprenyltransferase
MTAPRWRIWLGAIRPRTLTAAVAPVMVGSALAARDGRYDAVAAGLCLAFALLIQIGTNLANDYHDFVRGADTPARVGPLRAVAAGVITPASMRRAAWGVLGVAFCTGLTLIAWGGPWLIAVGVASVVCAIAYTGGPWPLGYHGLGDVFVFIFFGLVAVGVTYFVQAARFGIDPLLAAAPVGLLAANILVVNNYRDFTTDAAAGKRTLVVRFGRRAARRQFVISWAFAFALPLVLALRSRAPGCSLPLLLAPVAWGQMQRLKESAAAATLIVLLEDCAKSLAAFALLFSAGLLLPPF